MNRLKTIRIGPLLLCIAGFFLAAYKIDLSWFNVHMSRDISRGLNFLNDLPILGPEMGWDYIRLPGPLLYFFYWVFSLFTTHLTDILLTKIGLTFISLYFLTKTLKKYYSDLQVLFFLVLLICSPEFLAGQRDLWNPSWVFLFNIVTLKLFLEYFETGKKYYFWLAGFVALIGVQFHFSALVSFLAGFLTVISERKIGRKSLATVVFILVAGAAIWISLNNYDDFIRQLGTTYGFSTANLKNRLLDVLSVNYFLDIPLDDYDLFYFPSLVMKRNHLFDFFPILSFCFWLTNLGFATSLFLLSKSLVIKKKTETLNKFLVLYYFIFLISAFLLKYKAHLPYRYGFLIFPVQFMIMISGFKNIKYSRVILFVMVFAAIPQLMYYRAYIEAHELSGKTHHTSQDGLELTLRNKRLVYQFICDHFNEPNEESLFTHLHGRIVNKMRLKEMNWEQSEKYFGLWKFEFKGKATCPSGSDQNHYYMPVGPDGVVSFEKLDTGTQPQNIQMILSKEEHHLETTDLPAATSIMPLTKLGTEADEVILNFEVTTKDVSFLQLALDSGKARPIYKVENLAVNDKLLEPAFLSQGAFLVQNQYQYKLPAGKNKLSLKLKNLNKNNSYSRVDLFVTDHPLAGEEFY